MKKNQKIILIVLFVVILAVLYFNGYLNKLNKFKNVDFIVSKIEALGNYAYIAFIIAYIVGGIIVFPVSVIAIGGGIVFGPVVGTFMVLLSSWLSSVVNFIISRYIAKDYMYNKFSHHAIYEKIDNKIDQHGIEFLMVIRTSPGIPFGVKNYICGITQMTFVEYAVGSVFLLFPGAILYAYTSGMITHKGLNLEMIIVMGVAYSIIGIIYLIYKKVSKNGVH